MYVAINASRVQVSRCKSPCFSRNAYISVLVFSLNDLKVLSSCSSLNDFLTYARLLIPSRRFLIAIVYQFGSKYLASFVNPQDLISSMMSSNLLEVIHYYPLVKDFAVRHTASVFGRYVHVKVNILDIPARFAKRHKRSIFVYTLL